MLFLIIIGILLQAPTMGLAMKNPLEQTLCTMPAAEILKYRLQGYEYLTSASSLITDLADTRLSPLSIVWKLDLAFWDYLEHIRIRNNMSYQLVEFYRERLETHRPFILCSLLADHPDQLKQLQKTGFYKPIKK